MERRAASAGAAVWLARRVTEITLNVDARFATFFPNFLPLGRKQFKERKNSLIFSFMIKEVLGHVRLYSFQ